MKRTFRSLLSMVMALSMLLSMVLISGLTASAANAQVQYITGDQIVTSDTDGGCVGTTKVVNGNSWSLTTTADCNASAGSVIAYTTVNNTAVLQDLPFLVLDVGEANTADFSWLCWTEDSGYVWPFGSWSTKSGLTVFNLRTVVDPGETFTMQLWCRSAAGAVFDVKSMYLTDINPITGKGPSTEVALATVAAGLNNANATASGVDGLGITLAQPWLDATGYGYTYWNIPAATIEKTPYLVVDIADASLEFFGSYCDLTPEYGGAVSLGSVRSASKQVIDLREIVSGTDVYLCFTYTDTVVFDALYLTDTVPANEVLMKDWTQNPYINVDRASYGTSGKGVAFSSQWTDATGYGYWYPKISGDQIERTPYLVVKPSKNFNVGGWFNITDGGDMWTSLQAMNPGNTLQIYNLKEIAQNSTAADKSLNLVMTFNSGSSFTMFYLTDMPEAVVDEADPEGAVHVKDISMAVGNITPAVSGDFGVIYPFDPAVTGDQYSYYEALPSFANYPYLAYKLKEGSAASAAIYVAKDAWWGEFVTLPTASTERTVVNLTELACYDPSAKMLLQTLHTATSEFEYFYFSTSADFVPTVESDEPEVLLHEVSFDTNGGSSVYTQLVPNGGTVDAVTTTMNGYTFAGWYTDEAVTQAFDFATSVTAPMTLHAKWTLAGELSPVFGQLPNGTTAESASSSIRFVSVIDSLQYAEAGFVISKVTDNPTVGDAYTLAVSTTTVWTSINAAGSTVTAEELHGTYIFACTVNNIPQANFSTPLYVRAYVKDFNGNYTYTDTKTYSVTAMLG